MLIRPRNRYPNRPGLTLMELAVVLVILVGLAAIVVPLLPNMIERTNSATGAANCKEINNQIATFEQFHRSYPDYYDALTDGTNLVNYIPPGSLAQMSAVSL